MAIKNYVKPTRIQVAKSFEICCHSMNMELKISLLREKGLLVPRVITASEFRHK